MVRSEAISALANSGYRLTGPRQAVLDALVGREGPVAVEELAAALPGVGRATVFRTVKLLLERGLICRLALEDGTVRYQLSSGEHHHHLTCRVCGDVVDFVDRKLDERIRATATGAGFRLESHSVELYGLCQRCAAAPDEALGEMDARDVQRTAFDS